MLRELSKHISWGKEVLGYEEKDHAVVVHFSDGTSDEEALLTEVDGAHSKVRQQYVPNHKIVPTGGVAFMAKHHFGTISPATWSLQSYAA